MRRKYNDIGILDFGNSKFLKKKNGSINHTSKFYKCRGNRMFSSSNALLDIDTTPYDDIESTFYILIYFLNGSLPWKSKSSEKKLIKKKLSKFEKN